jgi:spore maturation protein SpmA
MFVAGSIQNASEPLTLEAMCELSDIAEKGKFALEAAINLTIDKFFRR